MTLTTEQKWFRAALWIASPILTIIVLTTGPGLYRRACAMRVSDQEGCMESADARAGQITTMVTRFNQFRPGGAEPIELVACAIYTPADLAGLVEAGYCSDSDLMNQTGGNWVWNGTTRKFEPEER